MNGRPPTSTSALGMVWVMGRKRVAKPPARIAAGISAMGSGSLGSRGRSARFTQTSLFLDVLALVAEVLDEMQVIHHLLLVPFALAVLLLEDARGRSAVSGEEEQQVVLQVVKRVGVDLERRGFDFVIREELKTGHAAIGRDVLILFADRLAEAVDLDVTRLFGQLVRVYDVLPVGVQRLQQGRGEASRRSQT